MALVATLISYGAPLDDATLARAAAALPQAHAPLWLAPHEAADITFAASGEPRTFAEQVRTALTGQPVDVVVQPTRGRRKRLFLADMDSTMIAQECIDELCEAAGYETGMSAIRAHSGD